MLANNKELLGICGEYSDVEYTLVKESYEDYQLLEDDNKWMEFVLGSAQGTGSQDATNVLEYEVKLLFETILQ